MLTSNVAQPVDDLVARRVLELLTTPAFREAVLAQSRGADDGSLARALAALGSAQSRMQTLDDDFYVRGAIGQRRYRSIRTRLEREVERLQTQVDHESKQRIVLHPTLGACGPKRPSAGAVSWCASSSSLSP